MDKFMRLQRLSELYRELAELGDPEDREAHLELADRFLKQAEDLRRTGTGSNGGLTH